jgi:hypothetical protein
VFRQDPDSDLARYRCLGTRKAEPSQGSIEGVLDSLDPADTHARSTARQIKYKLLHQIAAGVLSVPEIRTLLARLLFKPSAKLAFVIAWSAGEGAKVTPSRHTIARDSIRNCSSCASDLPPRREENLMGTTDVARSGRSCDPNRPAPAATTTATKPSNPAADKPAEAAGS